VQLIFQLIAVSSFFDKILDFGQFVSTARFEPAGVVEDKAVRCWILKIVFYIVFSALLIASSSSSQGYRAPPIPTEADGFNSEAI
jgi:hypothetical protein